MTRRLSALLVLGLVLLLSPLVVAFSQPLTVLGLPLFPTYLFTSWAVLVFGAWFLTRRGAR
jgi:hypothetical protein